MCDGSPKVTITNPGTRDLDVLSVEVLDGIGPLIGYRYTIGNNGTAMVPSGFENEVYLSANTTISSGDILIDTRTASVDVPAGGKEKLFEELLRLNATDLVHGAYALDGKTVKVYRVSVADGSGVPGLVLQAGKQGVEVACGCGSLLLEELQLEGRKRLAATEFLAGYKIEPGVILGNKDASRE